MPKAVSAANAIVGISHALEYWSPMRLAASQMTASANGT
jgi:hypothetical protein